MLLQQALEAVGGRGGKARTIESTDLKVLHSVIHAYTVEEARLGDSLYNRTANKIMLNAITGLFAPESFHVEDVQHRQYV